jgi:Flagellar transcriptional activator (FlhC)
MAAMRISDDRYHRERLQMELALRFLRHEARTQTIRAWTGLSDDRIRKLYHSYLDHARSVMPRHRGKSPQQVAFFTRSQRQQEDTLALATCLWLLGVLASEAGAERSGSLPGLARGTLLCQAFEAYRLARPAGQISFEHAVFLTRALVRGEQLRIGWCGGCGGLMVTEPFSLRASRCHLCTRTAHSRC